MLSFNWTGLDFSKRDYGRIYSWFKLHDHFKRTMVIPQGKFQEFLQLRGSDRTAMMKDMFQLHQYDLYNKTDRLSRKNDLEIQTIQGRLDHIPAETTVKTIKDKETLLGQLSESIQQSKLKQESLSNELSILARLKSLSEKLNAAQVLHTSLSEKKPNMEKRQKEMAYFDICCRDFKDILAQHDHMHQRFVSKSEEFVEKKDAFKVISEQYLKNEVIFKRLDQQYKKMDDLKREIEELDRLISVKELDVKHIDMMQSRKTQEKAHQQALTALKQCEIQQYDFKRVTITETKTT